MVAKFKPKFKGPYRVLEVKQNNLVVWRSGKKITVNEDHTHKPPPGCWSEPNRKVKKGRRETLAYKRSFKSGFGGPERKNRRGTGHKVDKTTLSLTSNNDLSQFRKRFWTEETMMPSTSGYSLRPRGGTKGKSQTANEKRTQQGGPVRSRRSREKQQYSSYAEEQKGSSSRDTRSRRGQQQYCQERTRGAISHKSHSLEVLVGYVNYKT
ncbi:uncharacterized protein TNCV_2074861 [Trichonephila clavipes]|nr:uncharacterized protein TNCV_2074861 [Trichonephila clavipes]